MKICKPIGVFILVVWLSACGTKKVAQETVSQEQPDSFSQEVLYTKAELLFQKKQYSDAEKLYIVCYNNGSSSAAWRLSTIAKYINNDPLITSVESLNWLKRAQKLDPKNEWYKIEEAIHYATNKQYLMAAQIYDSLSYNFPSRFQFYRDALENYSRMAPEEKKSHLNEVINLYKRWEKNRGFIEEIALSSIKYYEALSLYNECITELNRLIVKYPERVKYRWYKCNVLQNLKKGNELIRELDTIELLIGENYDIVSVKFNWFIYQNDFHSAFPLALDLVENYSYEPDIFHLFKKWLNLGGPNITPTFADSLAQPLVRLMQTEFGYPEIHYAVAGIWYRSHQFDKVVAEFDSSFSGANLNYDQWNQYIQSLYCCKMEKKLSLIKTEFVDFYPFNERIYLFHAFEFILKNDANSLFEILSKLNSQSIDSVEKAWIRSEYFLLKKDYTESLNQLISYQKESPNIMILITLAKANIGLNEIEKAKKLIDEALKLGAPSYLIPQIP